MIKITVAGLGLMGGSMAYALRGFRDCVITGYDADGGTAELALERGAIDRVAVSAEEAVSDADLTVFCSSPRSILENMRKCLPFFKNGSVVTDICGVKREILDFAQKHLPESYVGLHPMAGKEVSGFENADAGLFKRAGFIIVSTDKSRESSVKLIKELSEYVGAGRVVVNRADEHDGIIAYTSDLMHISAAALCADYPANMTMAHTAGAFRDCTRIANIDADLWTELLSMNSDNIIAHLDNHIRNLTGFRDALAAGDKDFIHAFLSRASQNKGLITKL